MVLPSQRLPASTRSHHAEYHACVLGRTADYGRTVFAVGPAGLIVTLCKNNGMSGVLSTTLFWLIVILVYYFIATFISIDKIIGKIYRCSACA